MPFQIVRDDITRMRVDAIVNAANPSLLGGGGVDGAIHRAAGPELLAECRTLGGCAAGEAKITSGYLLPARYVIHTVGPVWQGGGQGERELLSACYRNSLILAAAHGCETVAFPLISAGAYGYPKDEALEVAVQAIREFLEEHEMTVFLTVYGRTEFLGGKKIFRDIEEYIDDVYVREHLLPEDENRRGILWREDRDRALREELRTAGALPCGVPEAAESAPAAKKSASAPKEKRARGILKLPRFRKPRAPAGSEAEPGFGAPDPAAPDARPFPQAAGNAVPAPKAAEPRKERPGAGKRPPVTEEASAFREAAANAAGAAFPMEAPDWEELLRRTDEGFSQTLMRLIDERGMTDAQCYRRANVDRKLFSKIRSNPAYRPSKPTVFAFAVALELDLPETEKLLRKAGFAISHSSKFDIVLEYFIRAGKYNIFEINEVLFHYDMPLLGSGMAP